MYLTLDDGHDSALLDGRGALETVSVDAFIRALAQGVRCGGSRRRRFSHLGATQT